MGTRRASSFGLFCFALLLLASCSPRDYLTRRLAADLYLRLRPFQNAAAVHSANRRHFQQGLHRPTRISGPATSRLEISATTVACPAGLTPSPCWDIMLTPSGRRNGPSAGPRLKKPSARRSPFPSPKERRSSASPASASRATITNVEFTWKWNALNEIGAALYSSDLQYKSTVGFREYDDGWRIVIAQSIPRPAQTLDDALKGARAYSVEPSPPLTIGNKSRKRPPGLLRPRRCSPRAAFVPRPSFSLFALWGVCAVDFATPGVFDRAGNVERPGGFPAVLRLGPSDFPGPRWRTLRSTRGRGRNPGDIQQMAEQPIRQSPPAQSLRTAGRTLLHPLWRASPSSPQRGSGSRSASPYFSPAFSWSGNAAPPCTPTPGWSRSQPLLFRRCSLLCAWPAFCSGAALLYGRISGIPARHEWLAGIALGLLVFKPQFLVAIPLVLLFSHGLEDFRGLALSAATH